MILSMMDIITSIMHKLSQTGFLNMVKSVYKNNITLQRAGLLLNKLYFSKIYLSKIKIILSNG